VKQQSIFNKIVFTVNGAFATLLLLACLATYVPADIFPYFALFGIVVPLLVYANLFFVLYWVLAWNRRAFVSALMLAVSYLCLGSFLKLNLSDKGFETEDLKVMSFNVSDFRWGNGKERVNQFENVFNFIAGENPDILCFQEVDYRKREKFKEYPYRHLNYIHKGKRALLGIFSKYPIINEGTLDWPGTENNGAFVDILYKKDTIRMYNLHLESFSFHPQIRRIPNDVSGRLFMHLSRTFKKQAEEARLFLEHRNSVPYKTIVCGDFNNTQFSYVYNLIKGDMQDSFMEKGNGFGRTYQSLRLPFRIDYILADPQFEVMGHKNYDVRFSDHFPVMASFRLQEQ
jgi:endonuclease/exonuclease/phosphatase family metal-dependent hydrolase